jgi:hypothetical protein
MAKGAQRRAIETYRARQGRRGVVRFELQALEADRALLRALARRLVADGPEAGRIRRSVAEAISGEPLKTGAVLAALLRSPLVGADLDLKRDREEGREVAL